MGAAGFTVTAADILTAPAIAAATWHSTTPVPGACC